MSNRREKRKTNGLGDNILAVELAGVVLDGAHLVWLQEAVLPRHVRGCASCMCVYEHVRVRERQGGREGARERERVGARERDRDTDIDRQTDRQIDR